MDVLWRNFQKWENLAGKFRKCLFLLDLGCLMGEIKGRNETKLSHFEGFLSHT